MRRAPEQEQSYEGEPKSKLQSGLQGAEGSESLTPKNRDLSWGLFVCAHEGLGKQERPAGQ